VSGYVSSALRHECDRDGCYQDRLPSWDWMRGCFPRGSMPTDLDGVVEINGHVLFIEQKGRGGFVSGGQARTLRVLEQFPDAAVWLIRQTDDPKVFECIYRDGDTAPSGWHRYTVEQMRTWLRTWSDAADRDPVDRSTQVAEPRGRDPPSSPPRTYQDSDT
jgi:hypothetical protein